MENQKVEGLITYSFEQQIFKFKVNSGNNQELWGVNADFSSYELKSTTDAILNKFIMFWGGKHEGKDTSDQNSVTEIETSTKNGEQDITKENKLLTTNFQVEMENQKVEGLITYSFEQQIFKFKVDSGNNQELWGVNADFSSYELK